MIDALEDMGLIGPSNGSPVREFVGNAGASMDSESGSDDRKRGASIHSESVSDIHSKWNEILNAMRNSGTFDEFSNQYAIFKYIFDNDGYPSRQEFRKFGSKHGISNPAVDSLIKSLKSNGLVRTEEAMKCNVLAVSAAEMTPERAGELYEAIRNSIK